jgi:hypothetical protein
MLILTMGIVLGSLALAIDGGSAFLGRRRMQSAADAAALAGAEALALGGSTGAAHATATEYAVAHNGADSVDITVDGGDTVTAVARSTSATIFSDVLGQSSFDSAARAAAAFVPVGATDRGLHPIAVDWQDFDYNQSYDIFAGGGPGNFGWLGWDGCTNSPCIRQSLAPAGNSEAYVNPYQPDDDVVTVGDWVEGSTGVANTGNIQALLDYFIDNEIPMTIVVWDEIEGTGSNLNYRVRGFAHFLLEDYQLSNENRITGRFVKKVMSGVGTTTGNGFGVYRVTLIE